MALAINGSWPVPWPVRSADFELVFEPDSDIPEEIQQEALVRFRSFAQALLDLSQQLGGVAEIVMDHLQISDAIHDRAAFAEAYWHVTKITGWPSSTQYDGYNWIINSLQHLHISGQVLAENRVILLDNTTAPDWIVIQSMDR